MSGMMENDQTTTAELRLGPALFANSGNELQSILYDCLRRQLEKAVAYAFKGKTGK